VAESTLVSVLIFAYNHENYIEEAIQSVVNQKCSFNFEVLVTDDFSTDSSLNVIRALQLEYPDLIKIVSNRHNLGLNASFQSAVKNAKGDFIAVLGGDDYWFVDSKLEMQVQLLLSHKNVAYVHTEFKTINESNGNIVNHHNRNWRSISMRTMGKKALVEMLCHKWTGYPLASSACFRKGPLLKGIDNHPEILDYDLPGEGTMTHTSMICYGGLYAFIPIQTTMYRIRESSLSHYPSRTDQFDYQKKYYTLRLLTAESFGLNDKEKRLIRNSGVAGLFRIALGLGTIDQFQAFRQTQDIGLCLRLFLYLFKFAAFRRIVTLAHKCARGIKKRLPIHVRMS